MLWELTYLAAAALCGALGVVVLQRHPDRALNRAFALMAVASAYVAFTGFGVKQSVSEHQAMAWSVASAFWPLVPFSMLLFSHIHADVPGPLNRRVSSIAVVGFAVLIGGLDLLTGDLTGEVAEADLGWETVPASSALTAIAFGSALLAQIASVLVLIPRALGQTSSFEARRDWLLALAMSAPSVTIAIPYLISVFSDYEITTLQPLGLAFMVTASYVVLRTHDVYEMSPSMSARSLLSTMDAILVVAAADGTVIDSNGPARRVLGWPKDDVARQLPDAFRAVGERSERGPRIDGANVMEYATGEALNIWIERDDGEERCVSVTVTPIRSSRGRFLGLAIVGQDRTDEVLQQRAALDESARLQQVLRVESVGQLAGGVAHEFNNRLQVILGFSQLLADSGLSEDDQELIDAVIEAAKGARSTTRELLAFSRADVDAPRDLDLVAAVRRLDRLLKPSIGEDIDVVYHLPDRSANVWLDPSQFEQIMLNLSVNARDAMPTGGELTISVEVDEQSAGRSEASSTGDEGTVTVRVRDTGHGMTEEVRDHIFEPFFTTKDPGTGTGLGLASVSGIVGKTGGRVSVESAPDEGTTFILEFPLTSEPSDDERPQREPSDSARGLSVLVVEDERAVRQLAQRMLTKLGHKVTTADGPVAALAHFVNDWTPDIVLTDVVMPRMSGVELVEKVRELNADQRVVFMSGYPEPVIKQRTGLPEGVLLMPKPFTIDELEDVIAAVMAGP